MEYRNGCITYNFFFLSLLIALLHFGGKYKRLKMRGIKGNLEMSHGMSKWFLLQIFNIVLITVLTQRLINNILLENGNLWLLFFSCIKACSLSFIGAYFFRKSFFMIYAFLRFVFGNRLIRYWKLHRKGTPQRLMVGDKFPICNSKM